jgi:hypothetical protein
MCLVELGPGLLQRTPVLFLAERVPSGERT